MFSLEIPCDMLFSVSFETVENIIIWFVIETCPPPFIAFSDGILRPLLYDDIAAALLPVYIFQCNFTIAVQCLWFSNIIAEQVLDTREPKRHELAAIAVCWYKYYANLMSIQVTEVNFIPNVIAASLPSPTNTIWWAVKRTRLVRCAAKSPSFLSSLNFHGEVYLFITSHLLQLKKISAYACD